MRELDPHYVGVGAIACIYFGTVRLGSRLSARPFIVGAPTRYLGWPELDSEPMSGVGPYVTLSVGCRRARAI